MDRVSLKLKIDHPIDEIVGALESRVPDLISARSVPGVSISILRGNKCVWAGGFGVRSTETKDPVTADTVFEAYSCTKPLVAYAALKMCEEGMLDLDRPLGEYLGKPYIEGDSRINKITLRMALSHTSGLMDDEKRAIAFEPGTRWSYSTGGFYYVQKVLETVYDSSFEKTMSECLLIPLQMDASGFTSEQRFRSVMAQGHWTDGKPDADRQIPEGDADSLFTTPADYAKFLSPIMSDYQIGQQMNEPFVRVSDKLSWGLGWGIQHTDAGDCFWHFGGGPAPFNNLAIGFKDRGLGVVITTNGENGRSIFEDLVELTIGGDYPVFPWADFLASHFE